MRFRVSYSGAVRASLKNLLEAALRRDPQLGRHALDAAKAIDSRLQNSARDWGETCFVRPDLALEVRLAIVPPLAVTFRRAAAFGHSVRAAFQPSGWAARHLSTEERRNRMTDGIDGIRRSRSSRSSVVRASAL